MRDVLDALFLIAVIPITAFLNRKLKFYRIAPEVGDSKKDALFALVIILISFTLLFLLLSFESQDGPPPPHTLSACNHLSSHKKAETGNVGNHEGQSEKFISLRIDNFIFMAHLQRHFLSSCAHLKLHFRPHELHSGGVLGGGILQGISSAALMCIAGGCQRMDCRLDCVWIDPHTPETLYRKARHADVSFERNLCHTARARIGLYDVEDTKYCRACDTSYLFQLGEHDMVTKESFINSSS